MEPLGYADFCQFTVENMEVTVRNILTSLALAIGLFCSPLVLGGANLYLDRDGCVSGTPSLQKWKFTSIYSFADTRDRYWLGWNPTSPFSAMSPWGGASNSSTSDKSEWPVGTGGGENQYYFEGRGCNSTSGFPDSACTSLVTTSVHQVPIELCTPGDD